MSGSVTRTYAYGSQRISENQLISSTWTPSFYGYDGHGNVRFLTSSAGTVGNTYQFDAFGDPIASTGTTANSYLYSGERFDSNLSLYHLRARYYNMLTGRFETMDPTGTTTCCALGASQSGNIFYPGSLHKYVYTQNNPVNRIDPQGTDDIVDEGFSYGKSAQNLKFIKSINRYKNWPEVQQACLRFASRYAGDDPQLAWLVYSVCLAELRDWATWAGICSATRTPLCMIRSERLSEPYRLCWGTHRVRSRAKCICIRCQKTGGWQRKSWKPIYLDPSWTQIPVGPNVPFQNLLVPKKLLVGARRFELLTPCAQGRCATRLRYAPT